MESLHIFVLCCIPAVCVEVSAVMEVSGHVGGDVSIHCSGNRMAEDSSEHFNLYFCKGVCSSKNTVIQTTGERTGERMGVTRTGRYSMEADGGIGAFKVNISRLRKADAGRYRCGVGKTVVFYQEINLVVLDNASTVPPGSLPSTAAEAPPPGTVPSTTTQSAVALSTAQTDPQAPPKFTETTVVIIVSLSLGLLVCAIIPFIFYGFWWSSSEAQNKPASVSAETDCCDQKTHLTSSQAAEELQAVNVPDSSAT